MRLKPTAAVAAAYAIVGLVAIQLAVPPGYAAPVYPPAGIALAAAYIFGWPGVVGAALGSLLVNALTRLIDGNLAGIEFAIPLATAAGAALQAWVGARLLHRFLAPPLRLETPGENLRFALLAGPVACVVSASVATLAFQQAATVPTEDLWFTWWTWWIGDAIGVLIAAPIVFVLCAEPRSLWRPRGRLVALPLAVATLLVGLGIAQVGRWENERLENIFRQQATALASDLKQGLAGHLSALYAMHALFEASENVTAKEFRRATAHWLRALPSLQALGWSEAVAAGQHAAFEQRMQAESPGYRLFDRAADGSRHAPAADQDLVAITYIEPSAGNEAAVGVNALSVSAAALAIDQSLQANRPLATAGFQLTQETGRQIGVVVYLPVRRGSDASTAPLGVVFATMRMDDAVHAAVAPAGANGLTPCVFDATDGSMPTPLTAGTECVDAVAADARALTEPIEFAGRRWQLQIRAGAAYARGMRDWTAWSFAASALAATGLLGAFLLVGSGRAQRVQELVDERTAALRHEVAERKAKEQALVAAEKRFSDVFEAASVGLAYTTLDGRFVRVNARFCEITGYSAGELEQRRTHDIGQPADEESVQLLQQLIDGRRSQFRTRKNYVRPDGTQVPVEVTNSLSHDADGRPLYIVKVVEDLRERLAREAAEASNRAKNEFLSKMSHELRTPLNAMLGFAQLMHLDRQATLPPSQRERVEHIQRAGWHLLEMINDVLDLSRIETGALRLQLEAIDLRPLARECESMQHDLLQGRAVQLAIDIAEDARFVAADATRLRQVLSNLLSNAIKYNRHGGRVLVRAERGDLDTVLVHVTDTGAGLSAGEIAQLFEPFNRLGRERSDIEGTGIGLVIAHHLVELMHGRLDVSSRPGEGSTFTVTLQASPPPERGIDESNAPSGGTPVAGARRVVYIEDNPVNVEVVRGMLQLAGPIELQSYERGRDGLRGVLAQPPHLLLLDLHLPDIDGLEVLRQVRNEPALVNLPIVIVSADALDEQVGAGVAAGADAYLTKPIDLEQFLQLVSRLLVSGRS